VRKLSVRFRKIVSALILEIAVARSSVAAPPASACSNRDGDIAERSIGLVQNWQQKHIDETMSPDQAQYIKSNAQGNCPSDAASLCSKLALEIDRLK
jgi:hypothetical protein